MKKLLFLSLVFFMTGLLCNAQDEIASIKTTDVNLDNLISIDPNNMNQTYSNNFDILSNSFDLHSIIMDKNVFLKESNILENLPVIEIKYQDNCTDNYSGSHSTPGFYIYPRQLFKCDQYEYSLIELWCYCDQVPNNFTVYTASSGGTSVASTGWMGDADYSGPWGSSIHTANTKTISFHQTQTTFYIEILTMVPQSQNDYWEFNPHCYTY